MQFSYQKVTCLLRTKGNLIFEDENFKTFRIEGKHLNDQRDGVGRMRNIPPGTNVDTAVTGQFFLASNFIHQGITRPCQYSLPILPVQIYMEAPRGPSKDRGGSKRFFRRRLPRTEFVRPSTKSDCDEGTQTSVSSPVYEYCSGRPASSELEEKIKLISNCFAMKAPSGCVYHYDVNVRKIGLVDGDELKSQSKSSGRFRYASSELNMRLKTNREVVQKMLTENPAFSGTYGAYDGKRKLLCRRSLEMVENRLTWVVTVPQRQTSQSPECFDVFRVIVTPDIKKNSKDCSINLDTIHAFYAGNIDRPPLEAIAALKLIFRHGPCLRFTPVGRSFFFRPEEREVRSLDGALEIWPGYHQHDLEDEGGKIRNVPPGTTVDTAVTSRMNVDFFLTSHSTTQGTSRPCHYFVLIFHFSNMVTVILALILMLIQTIADAVPVIRELASVVTNGVDGVLIEVPEYEDREPFDYELPTMGGSPIMSLIVLPKSGSWSQATIHKNIITEEKDTMAEAKFELVGIIKKLKMIHTKTQTGRGSKQQEELSKAFYEVKNAENRKTPDVHVLLNAIKQSLPKPKSFIISVTEAPLMPTVINDYIEGDTQKPEASEDGIPENTAFHFM
ncbi:hypothetical protein JTE90_020780 [Oedothorax gibbosus]|uniref:Uncharacterized protein n=1 Tax=Oedothorax gibbosus TaxID=931172 RepID=A0AAV6TWI4_9ARAC|nr:hypothetical protein JTE90_020780 [Oedothorax gibbosus]